MSENSPHEDINADPVPAATPTDTLVVGIGASAGGIGALKEFFENVPADSGNIYVVVLHLSPEFESQLAEVLQHSSRIPVRQVADEPVSVEPDCVYVIPPDRSLAMDDGYLATSHIVSGEQRRAPVDIFFRSLAETRGDRAVSVILTGTGSDGSMGIKRVKEKGGVIIVQDPIQAQYDDMPRNAIRTGLVDYVLPIAEIPSKINEYKHRLGKIEIAAEEPPKTEEDRVDADEKSLNQIFLRLKTRTGHDFSGYKRATVLRRIARRINVQGLADLPAYARFIRDNPDEGEALLRDLLISVTNFFRDKTAFEFLETEVIPEILISKGAKDVVRVWSAGCATGEEAYSLAMLFAEQTAARSDSPTVQIFATDIDASAIARARGALYTAADVADVSPERLMMFFHEEGDHYRVRRELREMVLFAVHNVTKDPPFSRLDLVACRNLLIYLNGPAQTRVMETFHFALKPGGYLFLGSSESADSPADLFVPVSKESRIYQSRRLSTRLSPPVAELSPDYLNTEVPPSGERRRVEEIRALERLSYAALHQQLLEQYAPPSVVVDEEYDILHISEHAGRFMHVAGGEPSRNLLQIARPELRLELRTALYQSVQQRTPVTVPGVHVKTDSEVEVVDIIVRPVIGHSDPNRGFILVIFAPSNDKGEATPTLRLTDDEPIARQLEAELIHTKSQLRATIEQYEVQHEELKASNEELQAVNEELRSSAEELETSKEELQSVNEELTTVNQELKIKVEELSQSNNDFQNLINSTDVGTIFLDRDLRVKLFTQAAAGIFNLIPGDLGRPLMDLNSRMEYTGLIDDVRHVLKELTPVEHEVKIKGGGWYLMRILPYRTFEDRINGVVVTFVDISRRLEAEQEMRDSLDRLNEVIESISDAFYAVDRDFNFIFVNKKAYELWGRPLGSLIGKHYWTEFPEAVDTDSYKMHYQALNESHKVQFETLSPTLGRWLDVSIYPDTRGGLSCYLRDITERKVAEVRSDIQKQQLALLVESATDYAIFTLDENNRVTTWSKGAELIFGYTEEEMIGRSGAILFTREDRERGEPEGEVDSARKHGRAEDERWHLRKDGTRFFASGVMQPLRGRGEEGFVKICRDQTEKIKAQAAVRDRELLQQLVTTQEEERRRIARDLHDHLGQQMTSLRLKLESAKEHCHNEEICDQIEDIQKQAEQLDREVDFLAWEIRPAALDDLGLRVTLGNFVREWSRYAGIIAEFHTAGLGRARLPFEVETNLYRIAQEALNNIQKHAKAKSVSVLLEKRGGTVTMIIEDDGVGFDPATKQNRTKGLGLVGMRERAAIVHGSLEIESSPGKGTTIYARVPAKIEGKE